jgi:hypothetical protein
MKVVYETQMCILAGIGDMQGVEESVMSYRNGADLMARLASSPKAYGNPYISQRTGKAP